MAGQPRLREAPGRYQRKPISLPLTISRGTPHKSRLQHRVNRASHSSSPRRDLAGTVAARTPHFTLTIVSCVVRCNLLVAIEEVALAEDRTHGRDKFLFLERAQ